MKLTTKTLALGFVALSLSMGACSSDDDDPPRGDGDGDGDVGDGDGDAGDGDGDAGDGDGDAGDGDGDAGDGDGDGTGGVGGAGGAGGMGGMGGGVACDFEGFPTTGPDGYALEDSDMLEYLDATVDSGAGALLSAELWYSLGAPSTTYEFTAWENYETCSTCVHVLDCPDVDDLANWPEVDCVIYEVYEGTLDVTVNDSVAAGAFEATLTNAKAREVTIDGDSSVSTPVENGRIWCIDSYTMDVTSEAP